MLGHFDKDCATMSIERKLELEKISHEEREKIQGICNYSR